MCDKSAFGNEKTTWGVRMVKAIHFKLNGKSVQVTTDTDRMLLWILRSDLGLTGAKHSCGEGFCGACTVLVNNKPELSCQYPIVNVEGKDVLTIEGLATDGTLHPLQKAFVQHNALQCGFCTPGMILAAYSLLLENPKPKGPEIAAALEGNLCRCGSYKRILEAVKTAAQEMKGGAR
jgi:aerobic-type carbon monoxide dehydrogenase small subunit (CoxS/CutS family)